MTHHKCLNRVATTFPNPHYCYPAPSTTKSAQYLQ